MQTTAWVDNGKTTRPVRSGTADGSTVITRSPLLGYLRSSIAVEPRGLEPLTPTLPVT
jgi:hypothetical protein